MREKFLVSSLATILLALLVLGAASYYQGVRLEEVNANLAMSLERQEALAGNLSREMERQGDMITALIDELANLKESSSEEIARLEESISTVRKESEENIEAIRKDVEDLDQDFSGIVEDLYPSIVSIRTDKVQGSGFFIDDRGFLVTNSHVIKGANGILVTTHEGRRHEAFLVGSSDTYDLAVLKIRSQDYPPLEWEERDKVKAGQRVVAIGNPLGLSYSVSQGIISAVDREFKDSLIQFLQTDTPINQGNSGGPMINKDGKVVGVATAIIRGSQSLGFAIPSWQAEQVVENLA